MGEGEGARVRGPGPHPGRTTATYLTFPRLVYKMSKTSTVSLSGSGRSTPLGTPGVPCAPPPLPGASFSPPAALFLDRHKLLGVWAAGLLPPPSNPLPPPPNRYSARTPLSPWPTEVLWLPPDFRTRTTLVSLRGLVRAPTPLPGVPGSPHWCSLRGSSHLLLSFPSGKSAVLQGARGHGCASLPEPDSAPCLLTGHAAPCHRHPCPPPPSVLRASPPCGLRAGLRGAVMRGSETHRRTTPSSLCKQL